MENRYKREYRELKPETKEKLRNNPSLKRPKSDEVKMKISQSLKKYWSGVVSKNDEYTMRDYLDGKEPNYGSGI